MTLGYNLADWTDWVKCGPVIMIDFKDLSLNLSNFRGEKG